MKSNHSNLPKIILYLGLFIALNVPNKSIAQPVLSLTPVISSGLSSPIEFVNAQDGTNRVFIVQKGGTIRLYDQNFNFVSVFLTIPSSSLLTGGEQGLLSLAFHPDYETNGFFYVYYVNSSGNLQLDRYTVSANPTLANTASRVTVFTINHPTNTNHNGGELHFGGDGFLYLSTGDGGGGGDAANNAQNTSVLLGKMLRLAVNTSLTTPFYTSAPGNPFGNEIYALGLRNPFRWSFDRQTGDMWIGDVGQNSFEEINYRAAANTLGANYGWRCYEGDSTFNTSGCLPISNYVFPVYDYPTQSPASIIGGVVYRGTTYPSLQGYYVSGDFYSGNFYLIVPNGMGGFTTTVQAALGNNIVDYGETENGELYAVSLTANAVYRVVASAAIVPLTLVDFDAKSTKNKTVNLNWKTSSEDNLAAFDVEYSANGRLFEKIGAIKAENSATGALYSYEHNPLEWGTNLFYRLKMIDIDGKFVYSKIVSVVLNKKGNADFVYPSVIKDKVLNLSLTENYNSLEIINLHGSIVFEKNIANRIGQFELPINNLSTGVYLVRLKGDNLFITQKIIVP